MSKSGRPFPPKQVADLSKQSASNFVKLVGRLQHGVTLVLGAGVSSSAGIPFWSQLLERMCSAFFEHWQFDIQFGRSSSDKPPTDMSIAFAEYAFHSEAARQRGKALASNDLLLAAQQIKNCIRDVDFDYLLRHSLFDPIQYTPCSSTLLESSPVKLQTQPWLPSATSANPSALPVRKRFARWITTLKQRCQASATSRHLATDLPPTAPVNASHE